MIVVKGMPQFVFKPSDSLIFLTNRVGRLLANAVQDQVKVDLPDIHSQHIGILAELWEQDGLRQQDLALSLIKDKASITRSIDYLEQHNVVLRVADAQDKRNKRIYLTHKGKMLKEVILPLSERVIEAAMEGILPSERKTCIKVLDKIYRNLNSCKRNYCSGGVQATKNNHIDDENNNQA